MRSINKRNAVRASVDSSSFRAVFYSLLPLFLPFPLYFLSYLLFSDIENFVLLTVRRFRVGEQIQCKRVVLPGSFIPFSTTYMQHIASCAILYRYVFAR